MRINENAPIVPYEGLGEIRLYSTIDELKDILLSDDVNVKIINNKWIRYDVQNSIELFFHLKNSKLFRITTLDGYKGKLFGKIAVGTSKEEMLRIEPTFLYNDFEEVWESEKGIFVEMDAVENTVKWISVYISELDFDNFEEADW